MATLKIGVNTTTQMLLNQLPKVVTTATKNVIPVATKTAQTVISQTTKADVIRSAAQNLLATATKTIASKTTVSPTNAKITQLITNTATKLATVTTAAKVATTAATTVKTSTAAVTTALKPATTTTASTVKTATTATTTAPKTTATTATTTAPKTTATTATTPTLNVNQATTTPLTSTLQNGKISFNKSGELKITVKSSGSAVLPSDLYLNNGSKTTLVTQNANKMTNTAISTTYQYKQGDQVGLGITTHGQMFNLGDYVTSSGDLKYSKVQKINDTTYRFSFEDLHTANSDMNKTDVVVDIEMKAAATTTPTTTTPTTTTPVTSTLSNGLFNFNQSGDLKITVKSSGNAILPSDLYLNNGSKTTLVTQNANKMTNTAIATAYQYKQGDNVGLSITTHGQMFNLGDSITSSSDSKYSKVQKINDTTYRVSFEDLHTSNTDMDLKDVVVDIELKPTATPPAPKPVTSTVSNGLFGFNQNGEIKITLESPGNAALPSDLYIKNGQTSTLVAQNVNKMTNTAIATTYQYKQGEQVGFNLTTHGQMFNLGDYTTSSGDTKYSKIEKINDSTYRVSFEDLHTANSDMSLNDVIMKLEFKPTNSTTPVNVNQVSLNDTAIKHDLETNRIRVTGAVANVEEQMDAYTSSIFSGEKYLTLSASEKSKVLGNFVNDLMTTTKYDSMFNYMDPVAIIDKGNEYSVAIKMKFFNTQYDPANEGKALGDTVAAAAETAMKNAFSSIFSGEYNGKKIDSTIKSSVSATTSTFAKEEYGTQISAEEKAAGQTRTSDLHFLIMSDDLLGQYSKYYPNEYKPDGWCYPNAENSFVMLKSPASFNVEGRGIVHEALHLMGVADEYPYAGEPYKLVNGLSTSAVCKDDPVAQWKDLVPQGKTVTWTKVQVGSAYKDYATIDGQLLYYTDPAKDIMSYHYSPTADVLDGQYDVLMANYKTWSMA